MNEEAYREAERALWQHHGVEEVDERFLELGEGLPRVRVQLVGEGPPVLFVHGGPNAGSTWASVVAQLGERRCILLDRPGCGLSEPLDYDRAPLEELACAVLEGVLDALELQTVHLVGSSFGGSWVLWFAKNHPERVRSVVQMSCPAFLTDMDMGAAMFLRLLGTPLLGAAIARLPSNAFSVNQTFKAMGHGASLSTGRIPRAFLDWSAALLNHTEVMLNDRQAVQKGMSFWAVRPEAVIRDEDVATIPHDTHWFWGADDPFGTVQTAERMVSLMKGGSMEVVEQAGHLPWLDAPERAARAVLEHCR